MPKLMKKIFYRCKHDWNHHTMHIQPYCQFFILNQAIKRQTETSSFKILFQAFFYVITIIMGCIPSKKTNQSLHHQDYPDSVLQKRVSATSTCQTLATLSDKKLKHWTMMRKPSSIQQLHLLNFETLQNNHFALSSFLSNTKTKDIEGPCLMKQKLGITMNIQNITLELQSRHGYPYENTVWILGSAQNKGPVRFVLKDKIDVFVKSMVECPVCSIKTLITSSKTMFRIQGINCQCNAETYLITVKECFPQYSTIWNEKNNRMIQLILNKAYMQPKSAKYEMIGCSNCCKLSGLRPRRCGCISCRQCIDNTCLRCQYD